MKKTKTTLAIIGFGVDETTPIARVERLFGLSQVFTQAGINVDLYFLPHAKPVEQHERKTGYVIPKCDRFRIRKYPVLISGILPMSLNKIINHFRTLWLMLFRNNNTWGLIISGQCYRPIVLMTIQKAICVIRGIKLVEQLEENPLISNDGVISRRTQIRFQKRLKLCDVVLAISSWLYELTKNTNADVEVLRIPIIVDVMRFNLETPPPFSGEMITLTYCGNLNHLIEMDILLSSFSLICRHHDNLRLLIVGGAGRDTRSRIDQIRIVASELQIKDKVEVNGPVPPSRIPEILLHSDIMLLPRPFADYSKAGFPSKLGEYLASGRPVVTTATGDIPMYLTDGVNAYLVHDGDEESFADKVLQLLEDTVTGIDVGRKGRELAYNSFSVEGVTQEIEVELRKVFNASSTLSIFK